jgi:hypothetical protein
MNHTLEHHVNTFLLIYFFDILIFSNCLDDRIRHLDITLSLLASQNIRLRLQKCFFARNELEYLGHMISKNGKRSPDNKIKAVSEWQRPETLHETQRFSGFCNFYRRDVHRYSYMVTPLHYICRRTLKFQWTTREQTGFIALKQSLSSSPVLMNLRTGPDAKFVVSTYASNFALGAVLLQKHIAGDLRPSAYFAKVLQHAHTNYPTYDQELIGVVCTLKE